MNIRMNIDYSEMYEELDMLMAQQLPQMELYCGIGKAVCRRIEKGAAVMASEYLNKQYPDVKGFSPRSLRRMRDFYRTYENHPVLLSRAMQLGWIQNVVIMEADLTMELREWYMKASIQFGWTKAELIIKINTAAQKDALSTDECKMEQLPNYNMCINFGRISISIIKLRKIILMHNIMMAHDCRRKRRWYMLFGRVLSTVLFGNNVNFNLIY